MLWPTIFDATPARSTSAAAFASVTATTGRPSVPIQVPAVWAVPRLDTSAAPGLSEVPESLSGKAEVPDGSLAMAACVTIAPPRRSPPTAASRVTRRTIRRRACLMHGSRTRTRGVNATGPSGR